MFASCPFCFVVKFIKDLKAIINDTTNVISRNVHSICVTTSVLDKEISSTKFNSTFSVSISVK